MSIIISLAMLFFVSSTVPASAASNKDLGPFWIEGGVLYQYFGHDANVVIPSNVIEIRHDAFKNCDFIKSITIPNSVTTIDDNAFSGCTAESITMPNSIISIGAGAFSGCKFSSILIPNSVTALSDGVFAGCHNLTSVAIPDSVKKIGDAAFEDCSLISVIIPNGVQSIGKLAFAENYQLKSIVIPNSVTYIGASENRVGHSTQTEEPVGDTSGAFYECGDLIIYGSLNSYAYQYAQANDIPFIDLSVVDGSPDLVTAVPQSAGFMVNNNLVSFNAYSIDGYTYVKLRDVAMAVNKTKRNFNVNWDSQKNAINITTRALYAPVGDELTTDCPIASAGAMKIKSPIYVDGKETSIDAYFINGSSYLKLRDIGSAVGIVVFYDSALKSICIYSDDTSLYDSVIGTWVEYDDYHDWTISFAYGGKTIWPWGNGTYTITPDNHIDINFQQFYFDCTYSLKNENGYPVLYLTDSSATLRFLRQGD